MGGLFEIWAKPLINGKIAICFLNRIDVAWNLDYDWKKQTMYFADINIRKNVYGVRDLWKHKVIGKTDEKLLRAIAPHAVLLMLLSEEN